MYALVFFTTPVHTTSWCFYDATESKFRYLRFLCVAYFKTSLDHYNFYALISGSTLWYAGLKQEQKTHQTTTIYKYYNSHPRYPGYS